MTRKKFIKTAMKFGYSRNEANKIAKDTIGKLKTYEESHRYLILAVWLKPFEINKVSI